MRSDPSYPNPSAAVGLTISAFGGMLLVLLMLADAGTPPAAAVQGLALVVGFGAVGTLAARRVAPPQAERLGLRGFAPGFVAVVLLLAPVTLLASELESVIHLLFPPPDAEEIARRLAESLAQSSLLDALETWVLVVGIAPVVEEWFYRGVVQQGLVSWLGRVRGIALTTLLFALPHAGLGVSWQAALAITFATGLQGLAFSLVREASRSLLPAIGLHVSCNAIGLAALAVADEIEIPSFNAPGEHLPGEWIVLALISVGLGLLLCVRLASRASDTLPARRPVDGEDR